MSRAIATIVVVLLVVLSSVSSLAVAGRAQARPRSPDTPAAPAGQEGEKAEAPRGRERDSEPRRAQPREPAEPAERDAQGRRRPPPPRTVPPDYHRTPPAFAFPPVSTHRGFYYHPYFGFYFGPYYGPYYPHPRPYVWPARAHAAALRTRVKPVETEVWIHGYFAGLADDFDGLFQRLYLPPGTVEIEFYLEGYRTHRERLYLGAGSSREIAHQMQPLRPGERPVPPMTPGTLPHDYAPTPAPAPLSGSQPSSPYGVLALDVRPTDAQVLIDDEVWLATGDRTELVIHVPSGWHRIEVRREGYQPFRTDVELTPGATSRLRIELVR
jgi:hypothetical protein